MTATRSVGNGRYTLDERIATGGMGEVWRATDTVLGRQVAVKALKPEYADDTTFRARFQAEARNTAVLHHPGIAQVFDFGQTPAAPGEHASAYLVMELVPGEPLSALLARDGALPPQQAADIVAQASSAIAVAHDHGIVHRDVKPANLIVTPDGAVKVTDFGIARAADDVPLTGTGQVIGTPHYLSPEQAEGRSATPASDVYALGVVLYECLTGGRPFVADSAVAVAMAHLRQPVPPLPESVPSPLADLCVQTLAKDAADRPPSAGVLAARLREAAGVASTGSAVASPKATGAAFGPMAAGAAAGGALAGDRTALFDASAPVRSRRGWLLPALAATAVLVLLGAVAFGLDGDEPAAGGDTTSPSPVASSVSARTLEIDPADFRGLPFAVARADLASRGFEVERAARPGDDGAAGTVAYVQPHGEVETGTTVTLGVWESPPEGGSEDPAGKNTEQGSEPGSEPGPSKGKSEGKSKKKDTPKSKDSDEDAGSGDDDESGDDGDDESDDDDED